MADLEASFRSIPTSVEKGRLQIPTWIYALACALIVFGYLFMRLRMSSVMVQHNNCILGADAATYFHGLLEKDWAVFRFRKHALAVGSIAALALPLGKLGIPLTLAVPAALSIVVVAGALALFFLLRMQRLSNATALAAVLASLAAFGSLTVFSVVETYGVTFAAAAIAMLLYALLGRHAGKSALVCGCLAGVIGAFPGWANLPAVAFVVFYSGFAWPHASGKIWWKLLVVVALPAVLAVLLSGLPSAYADSGQGFEWQKEYIERYASLSNFTTWTTLSEYLASFGVFSFVSPVETVKSGYVLDDLRGLIQSWPKLVCWLAIACTLAYGIGRALWAQPTRLIAASALAVTAGLFVFYLYFNPVEAVLYSSQWILALFFAAAVGYAGLRYSGWLFLAVFALSMIVNAPPLRDPRSADPELCCRIGSDMNTNGEAACLPADGPAAQ